MQAKPPSSSGMKATTPPPHLLPTLRVGKALILYQVQKTAAARQDLETLTEHANRLGALSPSDAALVAELLARPIAALTLN